jgi:PadR family transcriptional regulator, regulatory protein PadR
MKESAIPGKSGTIGPAPARLDRIDRSRRFVTEAACEPGKLGAPRRHAVGRFLGIDFYIKSSIVDIDTMSKTDNLQGALELLVLKILRRGAAHGFAIAARIQETSDEVLRVEAGSLYPALHRMTEAGLLKAEWRVSEAGRRARFYELTAKGRKQLEDGEARWRVISAAVAKVLRTA